MSRYSGPQQPGAERLARVEKRQQAEARQREERERDAQREVEAAKWRDERPLTEGELDGLIRAVAAVKLNKIVDRLGYQPRHVQKEER